MGHHEAKREDHTDWGMEAGHANPTKMSAHSNRADHHDSMHGLAKDFHKKSEARGKAVKHDPITHMSGEMDLHVNDFSDGGKPYETGGKLEDGNDYMAVSHLDGVSIFVMNDDGDMMGNFVLQSFPSGIGGHAEGLDSLEGHEAIEYVQGLLKNHPKMTTLQHSRGDDGKKRFEQLG